MLCAFQRVAVSQSTPAVTSATTILNLANAKFLENYSTTLKSTFGTAPYKYSLNSGSLPPGILLSSAGKISGKASSSGSYSVQITATDSSLVPKTQTAQYNLNVVIGQDAYGGLTALPSPNGASPYFRVEKVGGRWNFVTPAGYAYWYTSVAVAVNGSIPSSVIQSKYAQSNYTKSVELWGSQRGLRMQSWGFNTLGEYSGQIGMPIATKYHPASNVKLPMVILINALLYELHNPAPIGLKEPIKDILVGVPKTTFAGYRMPLPDLFDPKFQQGYQSALAFQKSIYPNFATSPWVLAITTDDADELSALKSVDSNHPHPSFLIATTMFSYTAAQSSKKKPFMDPVLHSKYAWVAFLQQKYGTIQSLNAAWGSNYTAFGDSGGYGVGTGVLDEDGRHTQWIGTDAIKLSNAAPQVAADMDAFLYQFGYQYGSVAVNTIRSYDKNHLIIGPNMLNKGGIATRIQFLQALKDAGVNVLALGYNPGTNGMAADSWTYDQIGLPGFVWYALSANADSPLVGKPSQTRDFPSQATRAQQYNRDLQSFYSAAGSNGDHYILGIDWWMLTDGAPAQDTNWGLITDKDNAYDGEEDVIAQGKDPWGYSTGKETRNYGNFLGPVTQTNTGIVEQFILEQAPLRKGVKKP